MGAPDGGRDLEATFEQLLPDGEVCSQRWWVDCKGTQRKSVSRAAVIETINQLSNRDDVDVFVVASNGYFSNPTLDWVKEWQRRHLRPTVKLWDRTKLERLVSKEPSVAARFFSEALTLEGRVRLLGERFWHQCYLPADEDLELVWDARDTVKFSAAELFVFIAGEIFQGAPLHPWGSVINVTGLQAMYEHAMVNFSYWLARASRLGASPQHYMKAVSHIVLWLLRRKGDEVVPLLLDPWHNRRSSPSNGYKQSLLDILFKHMLDELGPACAYNCRKVCWDKSERSTGDDFFALFSTLKEDAETKKSRGGILMIQNRKADCAIGLPMVEGWCPLPTWHDDPRGEFTAIARFVHQVLKARIQNLVDSQISIRMT